MWRKHLSTADRIKVDKRNHELGLWLLDSLPKATMKEVLQTVCREVSEDCIFLFALMLCVCCATNMECSLWQHRHSAQLYSPFIALESNLTSFRFAFSLGIH